MSRYIKKHRRQIAGFAAPIFLVFLLVAVGLSVAPGWITKSYGLPGDSCSVNDPNNQCDACNGEFCSNSVCVNLPEGNFNTTPGFNDPQCPTFNTFFAGFSLPTPEPPGCWNLCTQTFDSNAGVNFPVCMPNDQVCEDMSGGNAMNDCRIGVCSDESTFDPANPSGCDYALDGIGTLPCINCEPPVPVGFDNCGNGVCEIDNGETFDSCSLDCRVPGWVGPILNPGDPELDATCPEPPSIVFPVPPQPPALDFCEDGDVCTENICNSNQGVCVVTDKTCDNIAEDLCCPAGCNSADDLDCIEPEICEPTPTPTPTPIPPDLLEGSGIIPCSLQKHVNIDPVKGMLGISGLAGVLGALLVLRSRKS